MVYVKSASRYLRQRDVIKVLWVVHITVSRLFDNFFSTFFDELIKTYFFSPSTEICNTNVCFCYADTKKLHISCGLLKVSLQQGELVDHIFLKRII